MAKTEQQQPYAGGLTEIEAELKIVLDELAWAQDAMKRAHAQAIAMQQRITLTRIAELQKK